ncbi:undecaprenyl-diphosphatase [Aneurinibacillus soli]|uniref:Phosphatidylglycerophosphatase B n=1 Tax=Aneurinibacillus soli TaxID=1500254 RepID=A0A0U4WI35_9BACL|nr:undecaprenyl-diphosphatase [Aneurinibacillus soli]BAU28315.1 Phosphatidylglycerophosphatase B [Aneurinibacillus soli]
MNTLRLQFTYVFFLGLLAAICFGIVAGLVSTHKIAYFDSMVISFIQGFESPTLTKVMKFFTFVGSTAFVGIISIVILIFLYKVLNHRLEMLLFMVVMAGTVILDQALKFSFHRERPTFHRLIEETGYSFPSGHSVEAFAMYGIVSFLLWRHIPARAGRTIIIIISVIMTLSIGISRIYLGVHYPSDVIGGYLVSGFWLSLTIWYYQWYKEHRYQQKSV